MPRHSGILSICIRSRVPARLVTSNSSLRIRLLVRSARGPWAVKRMLSHFSGSVGDDCARREQPLVSLCDTSLNRIVRFLLPIFCLSDLVRRQVEPIPVIKN